VKTAFKISANYNTGLNYYGRVDSLHSSGFSLAELWLNESFYVNAPVFVNNSVESFQYGNSHFSRLSIQCKNKLLGNIYVVKPFTGSTDLINRH
jgi:hypothetical protein